MARLTQPELARSRTPMTRSSTVLGIHVYRRTVGEPVPLPTRVPTVTMASTPMAHTVKVSVGVLLQCPSVRFYTPVFRRDILWYGDVCPGLQPSLCLGFRPGLWVSIRQSQFSALFSYMLWHIELKFCMSLYSYEHLIRFECLQFLSIFLGVMPLLDLRILEIHSFPLFSLLCFDILSWNFAYNFVLLYYTSSLSAVNLRQFLWELCPFWKSAYRKYTVFYIFSYMLWHIELKFCIWLCFSVLQIMFECHQFASIFVGVISILEITMLEIHNFPLFSLLCFDILSWNFAYDCVLLYYWWKLSVIDLRQFL